MPGIKVDPVTHTQEGVLMTFDPDTLAFASLGRIGCGRTDTPNGDIAVDRGGQLFLPFGACGTNLTPDLFRIDVRTGDCVWTGPLNKCVGVLAYAASTTRAGESMYLLSLRFTGGQYGNDLLYLSTLDVVNSSMGIAPLQFPIDGGGLDALLADGTGELYAAYSQMDGQGLWIGPVDTSTAVVSEKWSVPFQWSGNVPFSGIVCWRGDYYMFVSSVDNASTQVMRFSPSNGTLTQVAELDAWVIGAGVSICGSMVTPPRRA